MQPIRNEAQQSTAGMSVSMTGRRMTGAIGAAEQLVYNNNNKLITQQGESQTINSQKKFKKSLESFIKIWNSFKIKFQTSF